MGVGPSTGEWTTNQCLSALPPNKSDFAINP